jgi:hypothetical protein
MNRNTRPRHLAESPAGHDVDRRSFLKLTGADPRDIETAFSGLEIYGGRMDARQMAQIGQDGE